MGKVSACYKPVENVRKKMLNEQQAVFGNDVPGFGSAETRSARVGVAWLQKLLLWRLLVLYHCTDVYWIFCDKAEPQKGMAYNRTTLRTIHETSFCRKSATIFF